MTHDQVLIHLCQTVACAFHSIGDYSQASDGFCPECLKHGKSHFQHSGKTLEYVRQAVLEKLEKDGVEVLHGFFTPIP